MRAVFGKYEILEEIGKGGFGTVYKGRDPDLERPVAVKTCISDDHDLRQRFLREAKIAAALRHPNIVTIHDFGFQEGTPYLIQEFLTGEDLSAKIKRAQAISLSRKIGFLIQIARGLEYAHAHDVVHRDIKPANIRVLDDGTVKIMDFGIAKLLTAEERLTETGVTIGTASYLPPEQLRGEPVDQRSDIFAYGVLAYELLTYRHPFPGDHVSVIFYAIMHLDPQPAETLSPELPFDLGAVVQRCLHKDRDGRYRNCGEIVAALEGVLANSLGAIAYGPTVALARAESSAASPPAAPRQQPAMRVGAAPAIGQPWSRGAPPGPRPEPESQPIPGAASNAFEPLPSKRLGLWLVAATVLVAAGVLVWKSGYFGRPEVPSPPAQVASAPPAPAPAASADPPAPPPPTQTDEVASHGRATAYRNRYIDVDTGGLRGGAGSTLCLHIFDASGAGTGTLQATARRALQARGWKTPSVFLPAFSSEGLDRQLFEGSSGLASKLALPSSCSSLILGRVRLARSPQDLSGLFVAELGLDLHQVSTSTGQIAAESEIQEKGGGLNAAAALDDALTNLASATATRLASWPD